MSTPVFDASQHKKTSDGNKSVVHHKVISRDPKEYSEVLAKAKPARYSFSSYIPLPRNMCFESQDKDEHILLFLRQHPIVNIPWMIVALIMLVVPVIFLPILPFFSGVPLLWQFFAGLAWYLLTAGFIVENALRWLFNAFIITDERMIDIDFHSLIYKEMNYAQIDKIQDVSTTTGGVIYSILDVGSVFVQTAGEVPEFVFDNISHPSRVVKLLNELVQEEQLEVIQGRVR